MTFVSLGFLAAALAGLIPVVLHLFNRQRARRVPFSTLRFLKVSVEKTKRKRRVNNWLLLMVRVALLVLLAVGLAEPTLTRLASFWGGGQSAVAIVLDNSTSMGAIDAGQTRLETARRAAIEVLSQLQPGDQAALLPAAGPLRPEWGPLSRNVDRLLETVELLEVTYQGADIAAAIERARRLLGEANARSKQIYIISDMQQSSWEDPAARSASAASLPAEGEKRPTPTDAIPLIIIDCQRAPRPDVAIVSLEVKAMAPVAGAPLSVVAELLNASTVDEERHVELYIDGRKEAASPIVRLPPGGRGRHEFRSSLATAGVHRGEVRLVGDDGSRFNDHRYFAMVVEQGVPVAVVRAAAHEIASLDDSFYLQTALAPRAGGAIRVTPLLAGALEGEPLDAYRVIYLVNLPACEPEQAARLASYVASGGHLVWIAGDNVDADAYNKMNEGAGGRLLAGTLRTARSASEGGGDSWQIASVDASHPALAPLAEPASLYRSVLVYRHLGIDASGARVLARLDNGEPLVTHKAVGRGSVTLLGTTTNTAWSNWPLKPIFLPFVVRLTLALGGADGQAGETLAGQPLVVPLAPRGEDGRVEVVPPSGETIRQAVESNGTAASVFTYRDTYAAGVYVLRPLGAARQTPWVFAVNFDPREAEPAKVGRDELEQRYAGTPLLFAADAAELSSTFRELRQGRSLWTPLLAAVLVLLVAETLVSNKRV